MNGKIRESRQRWLGHALTKAEEVVMRTMLYEKT